MYQTDRFVGFELLNKFMQNLNSKLLRNEPECLYEQTFCNQV